MSTTDEEFELHLSTLTNPSQPPPSTSSNSFLEYDSTLHLPPSALPSFLSNLAIPSRYSLRNPSTLSRLHLALDAFALNPESPYHRLFDLRPNSFPIQSLYDVNPPSLSSLQSQSTTTPSSTSHSLGRPCGKVFKPGESVYRCRTCGLDPTCVLCSTCFHASPEHRRLGHDVTVSVHSGVGAGCCDCGDREAWKEGKQLECKLHGINSTSSVGNGKGKEKQSDQDRELEELKHGLREQVKELLRGLMDWSLEKFEKSPRDVGICPKNVEEFSTTSSTNVSSQVIDKEQEVKPTTSWSSLIGAPRLQSASIPQSSPSSSSSSNTSPTAQSQRSRGPFAVVLWNDEKHSFPQVIEIVSRSTGCSRTASSQVAQRVDTVGRDVILVTPTAEEALRVCKMINSIDLGIDVRDAKQCFEECIAGEIIKWMKDLMQVKIGGEENGLSQVLAQVWTETETDQEGGGGGESRFMRLAKVEERLWKEVRKIIQEVCVGMMSVSPEIKIKLSTQYAMIYPHLCNSYLLTDREPENSLIFLSVQIFTVPSICSILVSPPYDFLSTLLDILYAFFTEQTDPPRPPPLDNSNEEEETSRLLSLASGSLKPRRLILPPNRTVRWIDPESGPAFKQKRYFQLFSDLNHLITSPQVQKFIVSSTSLLEQLSRFLSLFEGMNPVVRAVGSHVEYESDSWVSAFNVTIQLSKLCRTFGQSFNNEACTSLELVKSLSSLIKVMSNHRSDSSYHRIELGGQSYSSIEFNVAKGRNSFHHPLTWLWAEMAKNVKLLDKQTLKHELGLQGGLSELIKSTAADEDGESRFLSIMEQPLRVVVLVAQIRAGLWVRNGFGVRAQQLHYKEYSLRENTYDQDLFFLQNSLVILSPSQVFASIIDRFDLKSWLIEGKDQHEVFEPIQAMSLTEELLSLLISLLSDPTCIKPLSDHEALERELIHYLALGPCVYSDLLRRISEKFGDDPTMDQILSRISHFKPPTGTNDQGTYSLKDESYDLVDPYFSRYTRNQREQVDKIIRDHYKKKQSASSSQEEPVIIPKPLLIEKGPFIDLAESFNSKVLQQLIFFALKHGRSRGELFSEVVVDQSLHLSMLALTHPTSRRGFIEFAKNPAPVEESRDLSSSIEEEEETREADEYVPKSSSSAVIEEDETNFIRLLIKVEEDERMKNVKHKVGWILDQLQNCLGEEQVGRWRRKNQSSILSQEEELEKKNQEKRLAAKKRQEAIMQQFAKAQSAFLESVEGEDEGDDDDEDDYFDEGEEKDEVKMRDHKIDFGTCIVCQDELEESKAFGILGLVQGSNLIRLSPTGTDNLVFQQEILSTPSSLDRDASLLRPFGIASEKIRVHSYDESGDGIARGYPQSQKSGFHASSCGHLMHLSCFETYCDSLSTRHRQQPTRCHPETIERKEFVCPLCKSLGNVLLPATPDAPAFLPYTDSLDNRSLVDWSNSTGEEQDEETLAQVDRLQLINDLDGSILFKPWRISLSLPAALTTHFGNREGLMIARLLQVVTALKHEVGHSSGGGIVTLTQDLLGYTIASIEVASRGTSDPSWKIGESSLRIIQSLFTTMQHVMEAMSPSLEESRRISALAIRQRLGGYFARGTKFENVEFTRFDPLGSVIEAAACTPSIFYHVVSVSFYTFLAQSLVGVFRLFHQSSTLAEWKGDYDSDEAKLYLSLAETRRYFNSPALFDPESTAFHLTLGKHLYSQVLPFLRRVAIVARVVFGEPSNLSSQSEGTEFERLLELLQIPPPNTVLSVESSSSIIDESIQLLRTHLSDCARSATYLQGFDLISTVDKLINSSAPEIEHSTIYELLGLPHHLDTLITSSLERKCERCEQTPENPAICLFCGELVCCQSFCCMAGEEEAQHGECNEHMWTCGGSIGIFFLVKRNVILYLHTDKGTFTHPPYLDSHGEVDNGRTRSRSVFPQYLHQGRYDEVRKVWLNQGVPTLVARKLEATTDHGGWTTM